MRSSLSLFYRKLIIKENNYFVFFPLIIISFNFFLKMTLNLSDFWLKKNCFSFDLISAKVLPNFWIKCKKIFIFQTFNFDHKIEEKKEEFFLREKKIFQKLIVIEKSIVVLYTSRASDFLCRKKGGNFLSFERKRQKNE